jgi:hypothetical protein
LHSVALDHGPLLFLVQFNYLTWYP